jgi:hypothetical protein
MSKEAKNEIDLLLRQLGRREDAVIFETDEQHLDADELNSYVANALPPPARARYTAHLADCSICRKMVAQLSAAQGPVAVEQAASIPAPFGLKQFLASLLSPMVLRYAVPALGVILVMVVGFIVMRRERTVDFVATSARPEQNKSITAEATPSPNWAVDSQTEQHAEQPQNQAQPESPGVLDKADKSADVREERPSAGVAPAAEPPPPAATPAVVQPLANAPAPPAPKVESEDDENRQRRAQRETAPADAVKSSPVAEAPPAKQAADVKKESRTDVATAATPGSVVNRGLASQRASKMGEGAGAAPAAERARDEAKDKDDTAKSKREATEETRSVGGRRFRKSGNLWIDTAYDSSRSTVNVRRGSEQYRALIADEPEIRTFAEQIDGEFILVWKGRAYRIR